MDLVTWGLLRAYVTKEKNKPKKKKKKSRNWKEEKRNSSNQTDYLPNSYFPATLSNCGHSQAFTARPRRPTPALRG